MSWELIRKYFDENDPSGFFEPGKTIRRFADADFVASAFEGEQKEVVKGVCGAIVSPSSFFVVSSDFWICEDTLMTGLQEDYDSPQSAEQGMCQTIKRAEDVVVGLYVAVKFETEWHRGRVLSANDTQVPGRPYLIRLIDFGEAVCASLAHLCFLQRRCASNFEAAVECQLVFPPRYGPRAGRDAPRDHWERIHTLAFKRMVFDRELDIEILKRKVNQYGETVWQVTASIPEEKGDSVVARKFSLEGERLRAYSWAEIQEVLKNAMHATVLD